MPNTITTAVGTTFDKLSLNPLIVKAVIAKGYLTPTPIQQKAIPLALSGSDLIGKAPTGTGKTAAFMLPALHLISESTSRRKPQVLVLTPTRELATQITNVIYDYGKQIGVNAVSILGGMPYHAQQRKLSKPLDIIVATPGRLIDYLEKALDLSDIKMVILDEADRMLDMGFIEDVEFIVSKTPKKRQTLLFTATMDNRLIKLSQNILKSPQFIEIKNENVTLDTISQRIHLANDNEHKFKLLQHLLGSENIFKAIIFSATKRNADKLTNDLIKTGYRVAALHGDMNQRKRNRTISDFRAGKIQFVIATDVAARGIDINDISHVINYDLPKFAEDYVHRIGRTGRAGKEGVAISFVLSSDHVNLKKIERFTVQNIPHSIIKGLEPRPQSRSHSSSNAGSSSRGRKPGFSRGASSSGGGYKKTGESSFKKPFKKSFERTSERTSDKPSDRKPFSKFNRFEKSDRPDRNSGESRPFKKSFEKKPFEKSDRPDRNSGESKPFKKTFEKKSFEKKPFEKKSFDKKPFKKPFKKRENTGA